MPRREGRSTPKVIGGWLYTDEGSISLADTARWQAWLSSHRLFYFDCKEGFFTARYERRGKGLYWYASRRRRGVLRNVYLGSSERLTEARLVEVAGQLGVWAEVV